MSEKGFSITIGIRVFGDKLEILGSFSFFFELGGIIPTIFIFVFQKNLLIQINVIGRKK